MSSPGPLTLLDIGAPYEQVKIGDKSLSVYGLSAENMIILLHRFPEAGKWLSPGAVNIAEMVTAAPKLLAAVIAAATGTPSDEDAERIASRLSVEKQMDVLAAVSRLTFTEGFGPFVQRLAALLDVAKSVNFGRVMAMNSPPQSSPSSLPDTTPLSFGS
jgi:hypothetical protein